MFRQSYPQNGEQPNLNDDFRGEDKGNHDDCQYLEEKYRKGFHSIDANTLIQTQTNKYTGNK